MKRRLYLGLMAGGFSAGCLDSGSDEPAVSEGGDDDNDGNNDADTQAVESVAFDRRWETDLGANQVDKHRFDVAATSEMVVVGSQAGLTALELDDGEQRWHREDWTSFETVDVDANGVTALTTESDLVSVDPASGGRSWSTSIGGRDGQVTPITVTDGYVVVRDGVQTISVDRDSGETVATLDRAGSAIVGTNEVALVTTSMESIAFDPATGETLWTADPGLYSGSVVVDGLIVCPTRDGLVALDADSGDEAWHAQIGTLSVSQSRVATTAGMAVVVDSDDVLHGVDIESGSLQWSTDLGDVFIPFRPPATDRGVVVVEAEDDVKAVDANSGDVRDALRRSTIMGGVAADGCFVAASMDVTAYDLY